MELNRILIVTLVLIFLIMVGFFYFQPPKGIKIGVLSALTGPGKEWGTAEMEAVVLAVKEANKAGGINGKEIELVIEDTQTDFAKTLSAYKKLVDVDRVDKIIGPTWNEFTNVVLPAAKSDNIFLVAPSASFDKVPVKSPYFFSTSHSVKWRTVPIAKNIAQKNLKKIAVVHDENQFTELVYRFFMEEARKNKLNIVVDIITKPEEKDYRTDALKLIDKEADAVYVLIAFWPNIGEFVKQAQVLGFNGQIYTTENIEFGDFMKSYGEYSDGVIYSFPETGPEHDNFIEKFKKEYGRLPSAPSADTAYDAVTLLILSLKSGATTKDEIASYFKSVKDYSGAGHFITFDEFGQVATKNYYLKTIKNGTYAILV